MGTRTVLKWKNKYSDETGFVGRIMGDTFVSVSSAEDAKKFKSSKEAEETVSYLKERGEGENNDFYLWGY